MAWALIPALGRLKPAESLRPAWSTWRVPVSHSETTDGLLMIKPAAPGCCVLSDMSREMGLWGSVGCPSALGSNWTG